MTNDQKAKIDNWFRSKFGGMPKCPACGERIFTVDEDLFGIPKAGNFTTVIPVVVLVCRNCACATPFSSAMMGL